MKETKEKNSGPKDQVLDVVIKQIAYHKYSILVRLWWIQSSIFNGGLSGLPASGL
jgi:hypothetical protein